AAAPRGGREPDRQRRGQNADRERPPEAVPVELDRLRDELTHGALCRRERGRHRLVRARGHASDATTPNAASTRGTASASAANASSKRHRSRSNSSGLFETARSSTAGTPASAA